MAGHDGCYRGGCWSVVRSSVACADYLVCYGSGAKHFNVLEGARPSRCTESKTAMAMSQGSWDLECLDDLERRVKLTQTVLCKDRVGNSLGNLRCQARTLSALVKTWVATTVHDVVVRVL